MKLSLPQQQAVIALYAGMYDTPRAIFYDERERLESLRFWGVIWLPFYCDVDGQTIWPSQWASTPEKDIEWSEIDHWHIHHTTYDSLIKHGLCGTRGILTPEGEQHALALRAAHTLKRLAEE